MSIRKHVNLSLQEQIENYPLTLHAHHHTYTHPQYNTQRIPCVSGRGILFFRMANQGHCNNDGFMTRQAG